MDLLCFPFVFAPFFDGRMSSNSNCFLVSLQALSTMVAIYIQAAPRCAWKRARSKPVSLQGGGESAVVEGAGTLARTIRFFLPDQIVRRYHCNSIWSGNIYQYLTKRKEKKHPGDLNTGATVDEKHGIHITWVNFQSPCVIAIATEFF